MLKNLKNLMGQFASFCRLEAAIVEELEEQHNDVYALKEHATKDQAAIRALEERVSKLEIILRQKVKV